MTIEPIESADPSGRYYTVIYDDGHGNDVDGQLFVHLTDEGIVIDLYDKDGDKLIASAYQFADDLMELVH